MILVVLTTIDAPTRRADVQMVRPKWPLTQARAEVDRRDAPGVRYRLNPDEPENVRLLIDAALMEGAAA